ncbi:MAG: hypothetical protein ACK5O2_16840 [Microthrixaceae bacterium]
MDGTRQVAGLRTVVVAVVAIVTAFGSWTNVGATGAADPDGGSGSEVAVQESAPGASRLQRFDRDTAATMAATLETAPLDSAAAQDAATSATEALEAAPFFVDTQCSIEAGTGVCMRRRVTADTSPATEPAPPVTGADLGPRGVAESEPVLSAATTEVSDAFAEVCDGSGSDGFRVQPVYAYVGAAPSQAALDEIAAAIEDADRDLGYSAERTGGERAVRWVTNSGSPGCRVMVETARITTGATDFEALMDDLEAQGVVPQIGQGSVKHLVWTEGEILQPATPGGPRPSTCGLGENYLDDKPLDPSNLNDNLWGTRAAIDDRCWGYSGGGSVPLHELTHTLGAVQQSAPNYANGGHCDDEYDLMCYGPGMRQVCPSTMGGRLSESMLDCNNDDYFDTDPVVGEYLCNRWNTSDSPYLEGWDVAQPPRAVRNLSVTGSPGRLHVSHAGTASCYGADYYRIAISGRGSYTTSSLNWSIAVPAGRYDVTVTPHSPYGPVFGAPVTRTSVFVPVLPPNRPPVGAMVLSLTDGRGYGMLGWAMDPDTGGPVRMRMVIPGVVIREYDWNYTWYDMPRYTGWNRTEAFLFLAQLPPGTHEICFDAQDANTGAWTRLECRTHSVK